MAPAASVPVLLPAAAVALMAMALQLLDAEAAARPPAPIGLPGCNTTCGDVSVPYPFGYGPSHCYWRGLNLTCDTNHHPPRLLLGDGSLWLRVAEISLSNATVRVMHTGPIIDSTGDLTSPGWNASLQFGRGFRERGYLLSSQNDLVVSGCNVMATIWVDIVGEKTKIVGGCASFCTPDDDIGSGLHTPEEDKFCSGTVGCCVAPLTSSGVPVRNGVQATWLHTGSNHTGDQIHWPGIVFVVEHGWLNTYTLLWGGFKEAPLLLDFAVTQGLPPNQGWSNCSQDVKRMVCKSKHSKCVATGPGYACHCKDGYDGNPYLAGGCQDVDECKFSSEKRVCFGVCINTIGSYVCQCPQGTYGDPGVEGGCINYKYKKDTRSPTVIMPGCNTTCGDVIVPYPFGFGQPGCYWPGLNLTCDTRHSPPRLLLDGNATLQVVYISLQNSTVHVVHHHHGAHGSTDDWSTTDGDHTMDEVRLPDIGEPYALSTGNEFNVFSVCNMRAYLHGEYRNGSNHTDSIISRAPILTETSRGWYDSGHAPISAGSTPERVEFTDSLCLSAPLAFISEVGLTDQWNKIVDTSYKTTRYISSPIVLQWAVKQGLLEPAADNKSGKCPGEVAKHICRSEHSDCRQENGGYTCQCFAGYFGNPYIPYGCQDLCNATAVSVGLPCFGYCNLKPPGQQPPIDCWCPGGTRGDPNKLGGCVKTQAATGLIIGLSVASGPVLLLLFLGIIFLRRKIKKYRIKLQKEKYFNQNRGQLLQQLLSQKADIAERMIIPLDELAKATNNFDKARQIGGGGHGTVYKGILSDLHVVAIKKSKITMQKEIDEFINEVAILSQINHKNVVKLFGCCLETEVPLLVYEFIPNGTLDKHLHIEQPNRSLSWSKRLRIATEIATSLAYLHSSVSIPIIHRDIKSSNILLDDKMTSKISDFGASRYIPIDKRELTTRIQGTFGYLDIECFHTGRLTEKSDVYSFGVLLVELLTRKRPTCLHLSNEYGGLVPRFLSLLESGNLVEIMDPQVLEEGGTEVQEVAMLAASCINLRGDERPTMRQVEITLEARASTTFQQNVQER